jgi:hypothetical protein
VFLPHNLGPKLKEERQELSSKGFDQMNQRFTRLSVRFLLAAAVAAWGQISFADVDSSASADELNYDSIVDQLSKENSAMDATTRAKQMNRLGADPLDLVVMHGGVGFTTFVQRVHLPSGPSYTLNQRGIQAALGIDLFSPNWMAEGTARSFGEEGDSTVRSSVQEFELKVLYKDRTSKYLGFRAGGGLSGRYLTIKEQGQDEKEYTTPTSVATVGGDIFFTDKFSIGADINARSALIGETIDRNSFDATLRLDTHF